MKKLFILFFAISLFTISCGKKADQKGTHVHDDGAVHADHNDSTKQQQVMPMDSTMTETPEDTLAHGHSHDH